LGRRLAFFREIGTDFLKGNIMSQEIFQLASGAAQIYEEQKVPAMFRPLAVATLDRVALRADDAILDIACG
jgi:hypothetical protein